MRIWLNHWFSTSYNIINLMKDGEDDFYFIGSNRNANSVMKLACSEWYQEPDIKVNSKEYLEYCLDFCKEHNIDVFVPHKGRIIISKNKKLFDDIGVKVMVDSYDSVSVLDDKDKAYIKMRELGLTCIPEYRVVNTKEEFLKAIEDLKGKYDRVCCKKVSDIGGMSFTKLDKQEQMDAYLIKYDIDSNPTMVMPYLGGNEISVDCLVTPTGNIKVPRVKNGTRIEHIEYDEEILDMCDMLLDGFKIETPCNIQFLQDLNGNTYILEINPRMSGGVQLASIGADVNIPNIALNKLIGVNKPWSINKEEKYVSHVDKIVTFY